MIDKIAILGAGTMGTGIAQAFALGGYPVSIWAMDQQLAQHAKDEVFKSLESLTLQSTISPTDAQQAFVRIRFDLQLEDALTDADFVQETIIENSREKRKLFDRLRRQISPNTIIASNTSALNIFDVAPIELLPQLLIVHWYHPAQIMPLVDVIKSEQAPQEMVEEVLTVLRFCGKMPVCMKRFLNGYIVNRLLQCLNQEIFFLLDNGYCTPEDIDYASRLSFIPRAMVLGLCKKMDFGGLDITANNFANKSYTPPSFSGLPETLSDLITDGNLGIKTGRGFFDYTGQNLTELTAKRDRQLIEAIMMAKRFLDDTV